VDPEKRPTCLLFWNGQEFTMGEKISQGTVDSARDHIHR